MVNLDILLGDCNDVLKGFPENHFDSCVTDPPYGLEFLGKEWDNLGNGNIKPPMAGPGPADRARTDYGDFSTYGKQMQAWHETWARNVYRVLKPGAYILAFSGSRTVHRLGCALEDAGFEVRDMVVWIHSQGFPKGINPSKAFDRDAGVTPEVVGFKEAGIGTGDEFGFMQSEKTQDIGNKIPITAPTTEEAKKWSGWGTHLSPAFEPIVVGRKPLDGTVIENLRKWGVGAINIDGARFGGPSPSVEIRQGGTPPPSERDAGFRAQSTKWEQFKPGELLGRYPKNLLLTHAEGCKWMGEEAGVALEPGVRDPWYAFRTQAGERMQPSVRQGISEVLDLYQCVPGCQVAELDKQMGGPRKMPSTYVRSSDSQGIFDDYGEKAGQVSKHYGGVSGASRFFYVPKPSRNEREFGLGPPLKCLRCEYETREGKKHTKHDHIYNEHATVKAVQLMRYLVKLVTPPGGTVLEPFMGSGTTLLAAREENFNCVAIEREAAYIEIAKMRISVLPQEASDFF